MIRALSFGAGVQSTAMLVLAARREIDYSLAIFADTGSEASDTLEYLNTEAWAFALHHGIELIHVRHPKETLYQNVMRQKGVSIPMRLTNGAPANRGCTRDWKVKPIAAELKRRGATPDNPATVALGISLDEFHRMKKSSIAWEVFDFPLIDLRMDRQDCLNIIEDAGLPTPPKSACWFCPFTSPQRWQDIRHDDPEWFRAAVQFERDKNKQLANLGKDPVWLTRFLRPLDEAITETGQMDMFQDDELTCDVAGYCGI